MQLKATSEQAARLTELLDVWEAQLGRLEARSTPRGTPALVQGRRILEGYRRTLAADLLKGIERVPATELFRAITTAQASITQLDGLEAALDTNP